MIIGSMVAVVSPMHQNGSLDFGSLERLVEFHVTQGTSAIVVAGSTGESATIDLEEHEQLIAKAVRYSRGRIPIVAGIGANSTQEAVHLACIAKEAGAVAGLSVVPYYNKPSQEGMYRHFATVAEQTDFPQILYNIPSRTACDMSNATIMRLAKIESIIGLKDATSDMARAFELACSAPKGFALYSGDDATALAFVLLGGHGVISVAANVDPKSMSEMCAYALAGDAENARKINERFTPLYKALSVETNPIPLKYAMNLMGLIEEGIRLPMTPLSEEYRAQVKLALDSLAIRERVGGK